MVIGIIGENCTGKSTLANALQAHISAEIITGKDYLRLAKSESEAAARFQEKMTQAMSDGNIIYVISEKEHIAFLPEGAVRILVTAELERIQARFRERMHGNLPAPVEQMLARKHGMFDGGEYDFRFHSGRDDLEAFCREVGERLS